MIVSNTLNPRHYMKLPICGYCTNAWDIIYGRSPWDTRGSASPVQWLERCRVGGCDPDVWDFIDEATGMPVPFPEPDDNVFHRRSHDGQGAPWRKKGPRLVAQWAAIRNSHYEKVTDQHGNVLSTVVQDDLIQWDEDEDTDTTVEWLSDDEIEW